MSRSSAVLAVLLAGCAHVAAPIAAKPEALTPWATAIAETTPIDGFLPIRFRRDHAVLLELQPKDLDRDLGLVMTIAKGSGTMGFVDGYVVADSQLVRLHRAGDKVYLVRRNPIPRAEPGSGLDIAVSRDAGDSIVGAFSVLSEGPGGRILADATDLLVSDHADIAKRFFSTLAAKPETARSVDRARSFIESVRGFPKNVEIDAVITFTAKAAPPSAIAPAADERAVSLTVRWSLFALPEVPMRPRKADDRVGYFKTVVRDYRHVSITDIDSDYAWLHRWRLDRRDPGAEHSPAIEPIRYVLDPSIPAEYRPFVREGILAWNRAFAAAGIDDAIVVEDAPQQGYDPSDLRFNVIRWSAAAELPFYAYGPSEADPRTGELLHAQIVMMADQFRGAGTDLRVLTAPHGCAAAAADAGAIAHLVSATRGESFGLEEHVGPLVREFMMHEVGHTLGLRHNFRGSSAIPYEKLHDKAWTREHGITASVMDYTFENIAADPARQGEPYMTRIGDYDLFAISYGYAPLLERPGTPATSEAAEAIALAKLVAPSRLAINAYSTDEDTHAGAWAVDPATSTWDLGDDPIASATERLALLDAVTSRIPDALVRDGEPWGPVRDYIPALFDYRSRALRHVSKMVGGATVLRAHRGDPGLPVVPLPADRQRRALMLVLEKGLSATAFDGPIEVLARTPPRRSHSMESEADFTTILPIDLPLHRLILTHQRAILDNLLSPIRLHRIVDNQAHAPRGTSVLTVAEMMSTMTKSLFRELETPRATVVPVRRNVQRAYVDLLVAILWSAESQPYPLAVILNEDGLTTTPAAPSTPGDARAAARHELAAIAKRARPLADTAADLETREHLEELSARITAALNAGLTVPAVAPAGP